LQDPPTCPDGGSDGGTENPQEVEVEVMTQVFGARGLYTSPSFLTSAPPGAASRADNVVVDRPGDSTSRRGFEALASPLPGNLQPDAWTTYRGVPVAYSAASQTLYRFQSGVWTAYPGTYTPPSPGEDAEGNPLTGAMRFFEAEQALYFNTDDGMYVLESVTGAPAPAGVVRATTGISNIQAAGQALSPSAKTAYRYLWGRRAPSGRILLGEPSDRVVLTNRSESFPFNPTAMQRVGTGTTVLVDVTAGVASNLKMGQVVNLTVTSDADFPIGPKVITSVGPTSFTYTEVGAPEVVATPGGMAFTSVATAVQIAHQIPIPTNPDPALFLQVYRADEVQANSEPSDEMYLVHERAVADMAVGGPLYLFLDNTPDDLKATPLYTNANESEGGIVGGSNYRPPVAAETALYDGRAVYANVELPERLTLTVLAVGAGGLRPDMVFTVSDGTTTETFVAGSEETPTTFKVYTDGSVTQNVTNTVASLVNLVNQRASGFVTARHLVTEGPGRFQLESRLIGSPPLTIRAQQSSPFLVPTVQYRATVETIVRVSGQSNVIAYSGYPHGLVVGQQVRRIHTGAPSALFPEGVFTVVAVPSAYVFTIADPGTDGEADFEAGLDFETVGAETQTDDDRAPGGWMISPQGNPDAVNAVTPEIAGDRFKRILRVLPMAESFYLLKEDGLYRVTGDGPGNFSTETIDATMRFVGPRLAWVQNGRAFALTTQGLATWLEGGQPSYTALQIESDLRTLVEQLPEEVAAYGFAIPHESKRRAYLWLPTTAGDQSATQIYVFNATEDAWTRWPKPAVDAFVHPVEDRLYIARPDVDGSGTAPAPSRERMTGTNADYQDEGGEPVFATVTFTPFKPSGVTTDSQLVYATYHFAGVLPTQVDVGFMTPWSPTPRYFTLTQSASQQPGTLTTPPTMEHSRGTYHSISIRHYWPQEPLRLLGFSAKSRYYTTRP